MSIRGNAIDLSGKNTTPYITIEFNILKPNLFKHIESYDDRDKRAIEISKILDRITLNKWIQTPGEVTGNARYEYFEPDENLDYKKEFAFYLTNSMILLSSSNTKHIGIIIEKLKEIYGAKSVFFLKERVVRRSSSFYPDVILPVHVAGMQKGSFIIYT